MPEKSYHRSVSQGKYNFRKPSNHFINIKTSFSRARFFLLLLFNLYFTICPAGHLINFFNLTPGPHNILNSLLKQLLPIGLKYLPKIHNCIWTYQVFPDEWRKAVIVLMLKSNKHRHKAEDYWTYYFNDLRELPMTYRLRWLLGTNNILIAYRYGFH